jgi:diguanylate cyclase (GGDEF)-like protein
MKEFPATLLCLERIFSISHEMIANPSLDDILHSIVQVATELVACETAGIMLSDASSNQLNFVANTQNADRLFDIPVPIDHSIAGATFAGNKPLVVNDARLDPRHYSVVDQLLNFETHSVLTVPLTFRERKIGVLEVVNKKQGQFDEADIEVLVVLAAQATIAIEFARLYRQAQDEIAKRIETEEKLRRHQEHIEDLVNERTAEVQRLAITDSLTGLINRRHLELVGNKSLQQAQRYHAPFSAMMLDIDHFKKINEIYGHALGDEVLRKLAGILRQDLRSADIAGRYGGEEFLVLMPHTNLQSACDLAERLLNRIRELRFDTGRGQIGCTASIGVVEMQQAQRQTLDALINKVDQALSAAKMVGRDQVFPGNIEIAQLSRQAQDEIAERMKIEKDLRRHQEHVEELVKAYTDELHRLAITDSLTGLFSHGHLIFLGNQIMQQAQRDQHPFSMMMIDMDHFKNLNDTYGHAIGDEALRRMAAIFRENLPPAGVIGRYGGDEFIVLLPQTTLEAACDLSERLKGQIRGSRIDTDQGQVGFSASIGVAEMRQAGVKTLDALIAKADQAMYAAKQARRDGVFVGEPGNP